MNPLPIAAMLRLTNIKLPLDHTDADLTAIIVKKLRIPADALTDYTIFKRSYDARHRDAITFVYTIDVETPLESTLLKRFQEDQNVKPKPDTDYHYVTHAPAGLKTRPIVIGNGPCGMFAGLLLAQMGFRPLILERGKQVRDRSQDTFRFWSKGTFQAESNVQFGEGGAGTFSDGKLYSRIKDPGNRGRKVITELVKAGAVPEILYLNRPHIGTYRLVKIVEAIRHHIEELGGEIRFQQRVERVEIERQQVQGVTLASGEFIAADHVILAVGHSARDTFEMLHQQGVFIEPKPFSIGFRIEHPQALIDQWRFGDPGRGNAPVLAPDGCKGKHGGNAPTTIRGGTAYRHPVLGAADYQLVHHCTNGRAVYSFGMCPGGQVVAATSEVGRVVTNGMSQYERSGKNANAGIVVGITPEVDYPDGPLAGMYLQRDLESRAFELGDRSYKAPGQLVGDFLAERPSTVLGQVKPTYKPGVHLTDLSQSLPEFAIAAIREAIPIFDQKISGFAMDDAVLTGVETRTSSPIRITRGEDFQSLNIKGLYPAGEGAGYAGGILSAGVDGIRVAEAVALSIQQQI
ncbi:MAG: NAD(P)/FAD-dependent oxidoreductase [Leptolyngbyaceae bacterium]|nr:NAD(P)/FAD-dependent oxidoreductase [Leptolyngbyaceae bacterium]